MKRYTTPLTMAVMAITMTAVLCGCPNNAGNLKCWLWNTDEAGVQTATPVGNFSGIDAHVGAYFHFDGGQIDKSKSWADYQVVGRDEPIRLNLINPNEEKSVDGEKCLSCTGYAVVGLVAIGGFTVPAIVDAVASAQEQWFDIVVPMGPVVETATLNVTTKSGDQFVVVLYGEASGITPPTEDSFRLTVKVQGEGSVAIDGVDQPVTSSGVFDVDAESEVYFTAQPENGWRLEKWMVTGDGGETWNDDWTAAEAMVTMNSNVEVIAVFVAESAPADTTAPVITLNGPNPVNLTVGQSWTDPGATATDAVDGVCVVSSSGSVNTGVAGNYTVTYSAADRSGNQASATRTVIVSIDSTVANPINVAFVWNGSSLSATITGSTAPVVGFEIYQYSAPYFDREVWNVANGSAGGVITKFRYSVNHTFRFDVVESADTGGFVDQKRITFNGGLPAKLVTTADGTAFEVTVP